MQGLTLPRIALLVVGASALLWSPSLFINDELAQAAGLSALQAGQLLVPGGLGSGYAAVRDNDTSREVWHEALPAGPGDAPKPPVGSTMLNVLALPVVQALRLLSLPFGHAFALSAVASLLVALGVHAGLRIAGRPAALWPSLVGAACLAPALFLRPAFAPDLFLDAAALQLVSLAATGVGAAYLFDLLQGFLPRRDAFLATLLGFLATPLFFWSSNAKYHALSAALLVLALWCYRDGHRSPPLRTALAFAVGGLAFWSQAPLGFVLLLALGLLALPAVRLGARPLAARAGAALAGLAVGLAPWAAETLLLASAGGTAQFVSAAAPQEGTQLFVFAAWNDPLGTLRAVVQNLVWLDVGDVQVPALAVLATAPFVLLAAWGWRRAPRPLAAFALLYAAAFFLLAGAALLNIGYAFDTRHVFTLWPLLVLLAAPELSALLARRPAAWLAPRFGWMLLAWGGACILLLAITHHIGGQWLTDGMGSRPDLDLVLFNSYGGLLLTLVLAWFGLLSRSDPAFLRQLDTHVAFAAAAALFLQVLLKIKLQFVTVGVHPTHAPYLVPWMDGLSQSLGWLVYTLP